VPTISRDRGKMVGTAQMRLCPLYDSLRDYRIPP
jgi:hypothetical protein